MLSLFDVGYTRVIILLAYMIVLQIWDLQIWD